MVYWGLVLARGSSKSVVDKNVKILGNKPLIEWVLEPMKSSKIFDEIWVSTDDRRIESIALSCNVKVHRRSERNASDAATSLSSIQEFLEENRVYRSHSLRWSIDLNPLNLNPKIRPRRQDWTGEFVESGHFYCFTTELIEKKNLIQGGKCGVIEIPKKFCLEIDETFDWELAELYLKFLSDPQ